MRPRLRLFTLTSLLSVLIVSILSISALFPAVGAQQQAQSDVSLSPAAIRQIQALLKDKESRSPAQRKIGSQLLYAMKTRRGEPLTSGGEVKALRSAAAVEIDQWGLTKVDIKGDINSELIETIERAGGLVIHASPQAGSVRARVPLYSLEDLATSPYVRTIRPAARAISHRQLTNASGIGMSQISQYLQGGLKPDFAERAANVRAQLFAAFVRDAERPVREMGPFIGAVTSEGDTAHRAALARSVFGVTGRGVKIGVLSDSVDFLERSIASGDLPPDVVVLEGQSGIPGRGEGTAMLEIIHDLAPGAKLFFATATTSIESFADNIRALRARGCDVIVDDIIYAAESAFHDDTVSKAVEEVIDDGALYFSSAGNEGNFNDGTSSVWEGDFRDSGVTLPTLPGGGAGGTLHDFGSGVISNRVERDSPFDLQLFWSDPLGASSNDYDYFILDSTLTTVTGAATEVQDGDDDPIEGLTPGAFANERIVIFRNDGARRRALHLNNFGGDLGIGTTGSTHGHPCVAEAFGIAAVNVAVARGGAFTGGPTNPVEIFSSDGFRRVFFRSNGRPFTPGRVLFSNNGGQLRRKPDLTAADGVVTTVPGFTRFFGTSAAAPHAAAIAALLKSAPSRPSRNRIRQALMRTALDIEATGFDRDSGAGVIDALAAVQLIFRSAHEPEVVDQE